MLRGGILFHLNEQMTELDKCRLMTLQLERLAETLHSLIVCMSWSEHIHLQTSRESHLLIVFEEHVAKATMMKNFLCILYNYQLSWSYPI